MDEKGRARAIAEPEQFFLVGRRDGEGDGFKEREDIEGRTVESVDWG